MNAPSVAPRELRRDLQALRGWSVLLVLFFHAGVQRVSGGYLGVDVFFVLSGYLITGLLVRAMDAGRFSFAEFYGRRAKRLLPAAYVVLAVVAATGPWLMTGASVVDLRRAIGACALFAGNLFFWSTSGYFDTSAQLQPLLHFWSLAVEEQFYLLFPLLLWKAPKWRTALLALLVAASLTWWLRAPQATDRFYLLPGRVWELALGGLAAMLPARWVTTRAARVAHIASLAVLVVGPSAGAGRVGPAVLQLAVVGAAAVVVAVQAPAWWAPALRPLAWLGDRSYAIYLAHWPLVVWLNHAWIDGPMVMRPVGVKVAVILAAIVTGTLLYVSVERPWHQRPLPTFRRTLGMVAAAAMTVLVLGEVAQRAGPDHLAIRERFRSVLGLHSRCDESMATYRPLAECETSASPELLVWGDSHAMHLLPAFQAANGNLRIRQATQPQCSPVLGQAALAPEDGLDRSWSDQCYRFKEGVVEMLRTTPSIRVVILASPLWRESENGQRFVVHGRGDATTIEAGSPERAAKAMLATVKRLQAMGRRVVFVGSPPSDDRDIARCLARRAVGAMVVDYSGNCSIGRPQWQRAALHRLRTLDLLEQRGVAIVRLADRLCDASGCRTRVGDTMLYQDQTHLTYEGSRWLGAHTDFVSQVLAAAR